MDVRNGSNMLVSRLIFLWKLVFVAYWFFYLIVTTSYFEEIFLWRPETSDPGYLYLWMVLGFAGGLLFLFPKTFRFGCGLLLSQIFLMLLLNPMGTSPEICFFKILFGYFVFFSGPGESVFSFNKLKVLTACGSIVYCFAGMAKVLTPSWRDGSLIFGVISTRLAGLGIHFDGSPLFYLCVFVSWLVIFLHLSSPVICLLISHQIYHLAMLLQFFFALFIFPSLTQVVLGMIFFHGLFVLSYLQMRQHSRSRVI